MSKSISIQMSYTVLELTCTRTKKSHGMQNFIQGSLYETLHTILVTTNNSKHLERINGRV